MLVCGRGSHAARIPVPRACGGPGIGSAVAVAQLVESWIVIPVVAGSSPVSHPNKFLSQAPGGAMSSRDMGHPWGICLRNFRQKQHERSSRPAAPGGLEHGSFRPKAVRHQASKQPYEVANAPVQRRPQSGASAATCYRRSWGGLGTCTRPADPAGPVRSRACRYRGARR